jgi:hypothetical protein
MNLRKSARRLFTVGAIATVTAIAPSTAAFAGIGVSTTGAFLYCNTYNDGALQGGHADCVLTDTSADSHSVYAVMQVDAWPSRRYDNSGGTGTTLHFTDHFWSDVVNWDYHYKVCRNVRFGSDNCSDWVHIGA